MRTLAIAVALSLLVAGDRLSAAGDKGPGPSPLVAAGVAAAERAAGPADPGWSETLNGLRVSLRAPKGAVYRRGARLPLVVVLQNQTDRGLSYAPLFPWMRLHAWDGSGRRLRIMETTTRILPWEAKKGEISAGASVEVPLEFSAIHFAQGLPRGSVVRLQVSPPTQAVREGSLPVEVTSPPLDIVMADDFPAPLAAADVGKTWDLDLSYRRQVPGSDDAFMALDVSADGKTVLVRRRGNVRTRFETVLPAERLARLAETFRKLEVWDIPSAHSEPALKEEGVVDLAIAAPSGASLTRNARTSDINKSAGFKGLLTVLSELGEEIATDTGKQK